MSIFWALVTAGLFSGSDFSGGLASKRLSPFTVLLGAHGIGLVGVTLASVLLADAFTLRDALLGVAGGFFGLTGVLLLYRRLAAGPMYAVAPVSAVTAAAVPALWGVLTGERLTGVAWLGVAVAIVAIVLVSLSNDSSGAPITAQVIGESLLSGVGFAGFFIFLSETAEATAPWPVATARWATFALLLAIAVIGGRAKATELDARLIGLVAIAGLGDTAANVTFLWAAQAGDLSIVAVLTGLYPVGTVLLARAVLGERMNSRQFVGLALALVATALIALG